MRTSAILILPFLSLSLQCFIAVPTTSAKEPRPRHTMAHSVTSPNYERERLDNGAWKAETYALAMGKTIDPSGKDESLNALTVKEMAEILANALHRQNYLPQSDPRKTDLMIVVNWGKTIPFDDGLSQSAIQNLTATIDQLDSLELDGESAGAVTFSATPSEAKLETMLTIQSMAERARRQANDYNAQLLGFAPDLFEHYKDDTLGGPQRLIFDDLVAEVEASRYFVILVAYDFKKLVEKKEKEVLWITRFSMRAKGRNFDEELANMAQSASKLFGTASGRMRRNLLPGKIEMGELEVIDTSEDHKDIE
ncbi:hypothetical protein IEN85_02445 [Pelagicoccus sp. NFK12]|uniref:Uncharacterized protein n=1 Tax=Pelagicoccus enzymogenes TaxID=2773457 RepID=A0A927IFQ6_9BACT|nr:hypothetical protein [Pelagicoccus enzymogenes]MBD5778351.1 hypothetical protein [Pelagicoccus enzymogenes]